MKTLLGWGSGMKDVRPAWKIGRAARLALSPVRSPVADRRAESHSETAGGGMRNSAERAWVERIALRILWTSSKLGVFRMQLKNNYFFWRFLLTAVLDFVILFLLENIKRRIEK